MNEFLKQCQKLKPHEIIKILDDHRKLQPDSTLKKPDDKSILISIKIPESLLTHFKNTCSDKNLKYQTQIKELMKEWLRSI